MRQSFHKMFIIFSIVLYFGTLKTYCTPTTIYSSHRYLDYESTTSRTKVQKSDYDLYKEIFNTTEERTTPKIITTRNPINSDNTIPKPQPFKPKNISSIFYYQTEVADYPELSEIEEQLKKFSHLFNTDRADGSDLTVKTLNLPDEANYIHLCGNTIEHIRPQGLKNKKGEIVKVVNYPEYEQAIRVETCGEELDTPCNNYLKNYHEGYQPMCKQNFVTRNMVIIKEDNTAVEDDILIPACCECVLKDLTSY